MPEDRPEQDHTTRFPADLFEALRSKAKASNRSVGGQIREYVALGLQADGLIPVAPESTR